MGFLEVKGVILSLIVTLSFAASLAELERIRKGLTGKSVSAF